MPGRGRRPFKMDSWYALHVQSCSERIVADKLAASDIEAFYPHKIVKSKRRQREIEQKFFPGYVFGFFDLQHRLAVARIPQVVHILGFGPQPIAIPSAEIEAVKLMVTSPAPSVACSFTLAKGDRARVMWGPFVGLEGYVIRTKKNARVIVAVTMLAAARCVEVDGDSLAPIEDTVRIPASQMKQAA